MSTSNSDSWQDRRGMFQRGKEVHEPGNPINPRRGSTNSTTGSITDALGKTTSNTSMGSGSPPNSPASDRRRSSQGQGMFAGLMGHKRGSEDYGDRRQSMGDQEGKTGMINNWYNKTFRGISSPQQAQSNMNDQGMTKPSVGGESKRGVME